MWFANQSFLFLFTFYAGAQTFSELGLNHQINKSFVNAKLGLSTPLALSIWNQYKKKQLVWKINWDWKEHHVQTLQIKLREEDDTAWNAQLMNYSIFWKFNTKSLRGSPQQPWHWKWCMPKWADACVFAERFSFNE